MTGRSNNDEFNRPIRICVEGNIASGKGELLDRLQAAGLEVIKEPTDEWATWIDRFNEDKNRWAFGLQMKILAHYERISDKLSDAPCIFIERSAYSCRHVFGQLFYNMGYMSAKEWDLFKAYSDFVTWEPDVIIYLDTPSDVCMARAADCGRRDVSQEYLSRVDFQYSNMIKYFSKNVINIDGTRCMDEICADVIRKMKDLGVAIPN